jgi:transposase
MSTTKINASKGRRYTTKEKAEILAYVDKVNAEKGRGGQMAATKKFKLSPLTIASWIRSGVAASGEAPVAISYSAGPIGKKLAELQSLHGQIAKAEKELERMKSQFAALKGKL